MTIERQEIHCHACEKWVQFTIDLSMNGNHVLNCPNCGHEHCRVVKNGEITDIRWDQRNGPSYTIQNAAYSASNQYANSQVNAQAASNSVNALMAQNYGNAQSLSLTNYARDMWMSAGTQQY